MKAKAIDLAMIEGVMAGIPFNDHVGVHVVSAAEGAAIVRLPDRASLRNHVGSQHAGALFTVADVASGSAVVATFGTVLMTAVPLVRDARISYRILAHGEITARANIDADPASLRAALAADGRVIFPVEVVLADAAERVVADATFQWHIRRNK